MSATYHTDSILSSQNQRELLESRAEHVKPRLLSHWSTTPSLNVIYVHTNRLINAHGLDAIFIAGPGHGGPAVVANTYLEGTYGEIYSEIGQDVEGLRRRSP